MEKECFKCSFFFFDSINNENYYQVFFTEKINSYIFLTPPVHWTLHFYAFSRRVPVYKLLNGIPIRAATGHQPPTCRSPKPSSDTAFRLLLFTRSNWATKICNPIISALRLQPHIAKARSLYANTFGAAVTPEPQQTIISSSLFKPAKRTVCPSICPMLDSIDRLSHPAFLPS